MGAPRIAATRHVNTVIGNSHFVLESHLRAGAFRERAPGRDLQRIRSAGAR